MNIANIKQLNAVDGWIDIVATIKEIKEIKQRIKSNLSKSPGQPYQVIKLKVYDQSGEIGLWAYFTGQIFNPGQQYEIHGMVKEHQNIRYLDYCDCKPVGMASQAPQNAPQSTNSGQGTSNTPDISNFAERLVSAIENLVDKKLDERFEDKYNLNQDQDFPNEPSNAPDNDIPF